MRYPHVKGRNMRIAASYKAGATVKELAIEHGVGEATIKNILLEAKKKKKPRITKDPDAVWEKLSKQGLVPKRCL